MLHPRTPRLTKHKGRYSLIFYDPVTQRRKWISLGTESKTVAERRARPMVAAYERQEWNPFRDRWTDARSVSATLEAWKAAKRADQMRAPSIRNVAGLVARLIERLPAGCPMDAVTPADVKAIILKPDSARSRASYRRWLSSFFSWAMENGYGSSNPALDVSLPRVPKKAPYFLLPSEAAHLLAKTRHDMTRDLIRFAIGTGLRCGELAALHHVDVSRERGTVMVRGEVAKGWADRFVPLSSWAREAYEAQAERSTGERVFPYSGDYLSHRVRIACDDAGLPRAHLHTMRHTFASWLRIGGASLDRIQHWLGHTSITTTEVYAHIESEAVKHELEEAFSGVIVGPLLDSATK